MAYSKTTYTYTGGEEQIFTVPFSYINTDYVSVYINNVLTSGYTYNSVSQIEITDTLSDGDIITIQRTTPIDSVLVALTNRGYLKEENLNLLYKHILHGIQEVSDGLDDSNSDITTLQSSLTALEATVTLLISQADNLDVDVDTLTNSLDSLKTALNETATATTNAQNAADSANSAAETALETLSSKMNVDMSNITSAGIAVLEQYAGTGGTGAITLTVWEED